MMDIRRYLQNIKRLCFGKYMSWQEYRDLIIMTEHILFISSVAKESYNNTLQKERINNSLFGSL